MYRTNTRVIHFFDYEFKICCIYVDNLVNSTSQIVLIGDAKLIPIMIPTIEQLYECKRLLIKHLKNETERAKGIKNRFRYFRKIKCCGKSQ